jgi:hypothetical protein
MNDALELGDLRFAPTTPNSKGSAMVTRFQTGAEAFGIHVEELARDSRSIADFGGFANTSYGWWVSLGNCGWSDSVFCCRKADSGHRRLSREYSLGDSVRLCKPYTPAGTRTDDTIPRCSFAQALVGSISFASLFFGVFTRVLTGVATMWVSGYCLITVKASSEVPVSHVSRSSLARIAGIRRLTL